MPRVTRVSKRFRGWNETTVFVLRTGLDFFDELPESDRQRAWRDLKAEILPAFITENPGHMPWGWWKFDCPANQFRTRTDGKWHQFLDPSFVLSRELSFGIPRYFRECDLPDGGVLDIATSFESEAMFLRRNQLLVPREMAFLKGV